jgi:preprotein translocase subunit SecF
VIQALRIVITTLVAMNQVIAATIFVSPMNVKMTWIVKIGMNAGIASARLIRPWLRRM